MIQITRESTVKRKEDQMIISELEDDLIMMDLENGAYLSLNKTARIIWEKLDSPVKVSEIVTYLSKRFDVDEDQCFSETVSFLQRINDQKALIIE